MNDQHQMVPILPLYRQVLNLLLVTQLIMIVYLKY